MTHDWRVVYLQEKRPLGYVIENGKSIVKVRKDTASALADLTRT